MLVLTACASTGAPLPRPEPLRPGQTIQGTLESGDARAEDGSYYDAYTLVGQPGQTVFLTQRSDDFDAYLLVGRMSGGVFQEIASDDDGAGGTDARIQLRMEGAAEYVVRANSLAEGEAGQYTLEVTDAPAAGGAADVPDEVVRGQLTEALTLLGERGLSPQGPPLSGSLAQGASTEVSLRVEGGELVMFLGVCGQQCSDLDLVVYGPDGAELGSDVLEDDAPIVAVEPARAGTYRLLVSMPSCAVASCAFGVQAFGFD